MTSRFALFCSLIFSLGAQAKVIFVNADRPAAGANGTTWATAFPDLQDALANSVPDDRIFVAEGTYYPGTLRNNFFGLQGGVAIFGGFDGTESDSAERDPVAHRTILSGDIDRNDTPEGGNNAGNSFVVIRGDSFSNPARLDGFTIEGGFNDVVPLESAGLNAENCMFSVSNCIFRRNVSTAGGGGAVRLSFRSQGLTNTPTFTGCIFEDNEARQGGAVIYGNNYFPVFIDCIFRNNTATQNGGGAVSTSGNPDNPGQNAFFTRCLFEGNSATTLSGGALELNFNEAPILRDCIFRGNRANTQGGAVAIQTLSPNVRQTLFFNTIFHGNTNGISAGGCILMNRANVRFVNCTIQGNASAQFGGAAFLAESQTAATFVNTIFWNNADRTTPNAPILAQAFLIREDSNVQISWINSLVQGWNGLDSSLPASSNSRANLDGTLASNEPRFVLPAIAANAPSVLGDLRLRSSSPLIDRGDSSLNSTLVALEGHPRAIGTIDLGAYEHMTLAFWNSDSDNDGSSYGYEQAVGSDPNNGGIEAAPFLTMESPGILQFSVADSFSPQTLWRVTRSTNLQSFPTALSGPSLIPPTSPLIDSGGPALPRAFYRLEIGLAPLN